MRRQFDNIELTKFVLLANKLPRGGGDPVCLICEKCEDSLGVVGNSKALVQGDFVPDVHVYDNLIVTFGVKLMNHAFLKGKVVELKCGACGYVTRWRR
jgi:hypothetical protein